MPAYGVDLLRIAARVASVRFADSEERSGTTVAIWRGMTGLKPSELQDLIGGPPGPEGAVDVEIEVPHSEMGWWSDRKGMALIYACTDPARGPKGPGSVRYDVLLQGEAVVAGTDSGKNITHQMRAEDTEVSIKRVFYAKREGDTKARKARLEALIGGAAAVPRAAAVRVAADVWTRLSLAYAPQRS